MSWIIKWNIQSTKILNKLSKDIAMRIWNKIQELKENPFHYLGHYEGEGYKFRIGDYRALIDVDAKNKILVVRVLDKRGRVYNR